MNRSQPDLDLDLPMPDVQPPALHDLPWASVFERNLEIMRTTIYDDAYYADSLARKITEPFVWDLD